MRPKAAGQTDMSAQTHEQILMEQFSAVLADFRLCTELYEKTKKQSLKIAAAQNWGILRGLAMAARQFGIVSLQETLDAMTPPKEEDI